MRRLAVTLTAGLALAALPAAGAAPVPSSVPLPEPGPGPASVQVDARRPLGPTNEDLGGVGWNTGTLEGVAPLAPSQVRIDAHLHRLSRGPGEFDPGELADLLARVEAIRDVGGEPLVILSYMPPWLAAHGGPFDPRDPTKVRPADLDQWQALVEAVVTELATAPSPAERFEVWNEPNIPVFWQDSLDAFVDLAVRTHRAVAAVEASTGRDLFVGGPALAFPDPAWLFPYLGAVRSGGLALDFVSWHYYGNYPFLGPDGAEGTIPEPILPAYPVVGRRNPLTTPAVYRHQIEMVRGWVDAALEGSDLHPELTIDEWNLSAGGFDHRHDTDEGAAFAAGVLVEMEAAGLDAADFYRAADDPSGGPGRRGDWGLVDTSGRAKPSWSVFSAWRETAGDRLAVTAPPRPVAPWLFVRATRDGPELHVLLANFEASGGAGQRVTVDVEGATCAPRAALRLLDGPDGDFEQSTPVRASGGQIDVGLPAQSVAWVTLRGCR